ncbi:hypothetical protein DIPPA_20319 [Diplonema papillatum]|nr:hypothetical protein DIPPA_20319 [Diplonema papillatum]
MPGTFASAALVALQMLRKDDISFASLSASVLFNPRMPCSSVCVPPPAPATRAAARFQPSRPRRVSFR